MSSAKSAQTDRPNRPTHPLDSSGPDKFNT